MGVTIKDAVVEYLFARRTAGLREATIKTYRYSLQRFTDWADVTHPGLTVDGLSTPIFRDYIAWLQASPTLNDVSVAKFVRELKAFSLWLVGEEHVEYSPFRFGAKQHVVVPRSSEKLPQAIDPETFERLLKACDISKPTGRRDHAIIRFLYDTGVRIGELCNLTRDDVDIKGGRAKVHGKGKRERLVFFGVETQRSLQRYRVRLTAAIQPARAGLISDRFFLTDSLGPMPPNTVRQMLVRIGNRAGIKRRVNPHSFRHGFGVGYLVRGGDIRSLQQMMGHSQLKTTEGYTHLSEENLAAMHAKFSPAGKRGS